MLGGSEDQSCLAPGLEDDLAFIAAGKDFLLGRTASGKVSSGRSRPDGASVARPPDDSLPQVHFSGKGSSVGMKHLGAAGHNTNAERGPGPPLAAAGAKWPELAVTKCPRIVHLAVGHEGQHAILVADDGSAFFVGTARRGEDGDGSK